MLVEREQYLDALVARLPTGAPDDGHVVLLGGEAGIGKTSLVTALLETAPEVAVRRGLCDSVTTAAALGPLAEALPELDAAIEAATPERRRLLFRDALTLLSTERTLLVLEDLHWADEATLGFVRYLGRRVAGLPVLVVVTFRDDEGSTSALTSVLGDLAPLPAVHRMHLQPLSPGAVASLVGTSSGVRAESLHRRTGGNPFFVTEVLATGSSELPATVRDAVLARVHLLSDDARAVLGAAAVLGPQAELPMVLAVSGRPGPAVDECVARGVLVSDAETGGLTFRHDVARETVEGSLPPAERVRMHGVALAELVAGGSRDDRRLAYHAEGCGDRPRALQHGVAAAERSARLGAHREAAERYRRALRFADLLSSEQAAALHESLSYECYLTDRMEEALASRRSALSLREETGDLTAVGDDQRWLSRLSWFGGNGEDALRYADLAIRTLEPLPPGREMAMAYSNRAQLAMLHADEEDAVTWGTRAIGIARVLGDREVESHALNNVGTAQLQGVDPVNGLAKLHQALDIALADDLHEHAARAYTNMVSSLVCLHRYPEADRLLGTGVEYCTERDLDSWRTYMTSWRARSWLEQGRYDEAARAAVEVAGRRAVALVARVPALAVLAQLASRRGEPEAPTLLDEVLELALPTGEEQRIAPVAFARAEAAWLAGDLVRVGEELAVVRAMPVDELDAWQRGELAWWTRTAGLDGEPDGSVAEPFAAMLAGRWTDAADAWDAVGCAPWAAVARSLAPGLEDARTALAVLDEQRAVAVRAAVLRDRHELGLPVPRQRRRPTEDNPAGLTARELEVLGLLAEGLTNAELARRLFLSEKTVDHHVSAVLRKLGEPSRARAVAASHERGLLPKPGRSPDVPDPSSTV